MGTLKSRIFDFGSSMSSLKCMLEVEAVHEPKGKRNQFWNFQSHFLDLALPSEIPIYLILPVEHNCESRYNLIQFWKSWRQM